MKHNAENLNIFFITSHGSKNFMPTPKKFLTVIGLHDIRQNDILQNVAQYIDSTEETDTWRRGTQ